MTGDIDRVDGWEIRPRSDGSFAVYGDRGLIKGPFSTRVAAIAAALRLPGSGSTRRRSGAALDGEAGTPARHE